MANKIEQVNIRDTIINGFNFDTENASTKRDIKRIWRLFTDAILSAYARMEMDDSADVVIEYCEWERHGETRYSLISITTLNTNKVIWLH